MHDYDAVMHALFDLEADLRTRAMWDDDPPSEEQLASTLPFCVDTLEFYQWLQFVFIPAVYALVEAKASLAIGAQILPMAEQMLSSSEENTALLADIAKLDELLA
ncbi:MAG: YqcC family protein [Pseudomonadota bacterium]